MREALYNIWWMKKQDCVISLMAMGSHCTDECQDVKHAWRENEEDLTNTFDYTKHFEWLFNHGQMVDDHNLLHHQLSFLEYMED